MNKCSIIMIIILASLFNSDICGMATKEVHMIDSMSTLTTVNKAFAQCPDDPWKYWPMITHREFNKVMDTFAASQRSIMNKPAIWLKNNAPQDSFYDIENNDEDIYPYVKKIDGLRSAAEIVFFGDLHGSAPSLTRSLISLKNKKYINDDFKIIKPDCYIVLLGDYVDSGSYGLEILYLLMRLKLANPEHVYCIRGNHEKRLDLGNTASLLYSSYLKKALSPLSYSFKSELYGKWPNLTVEEEKKIYNTYRLFSTAVYFGFDHNGNMEYLQCSHAGLELGYCPKELFAAKSPVAFELMDTINRATYLNQLPDDIQAAIRTNIPTDELVNFVPQSIFKPFANQLYWGNFDLKNNSIVKKDRLSWVIGQRLAENIIDLANTKTHYIKAVFRGHQHPPAFIPLALSLSGRLLKDKGYFQLWNGLITTVFSTSSKLHHDSFIILHAGPDFSTWTIESIFQPITCLMDTLMQKRYVIPAVFVAATIGAYMVRGKRLGRFIR